MSDNNLTNVVSRAIKTGTRVGPMPPNTLEILNRGGHTHLNSNEADTAATAALNALAAHYNLPSIEALDTILAAATRKDVPDTDIVERAAAAALDVLGDFHREDLYVDSWPLDEQEMYRNTEWETFEDRSYGLRHLIATKVAVAVLAVPAAALDGPTGKGGQAEVGGV